MSELPRAVKKRLGEKREDGNYIGVCGGCDEEVYANADGILRVRLFGGRALCGDREMPHRIRRYYASGPQFWYRRAQRKGWQIPDWAEYWYERVRPVTATATNATQTENS